MVVATTALVVVVPAVVVDLLRVNGVVTSLWGCLGLAAGLALGASFAASALWRRHRLLPGTVFSDLLVWGWLRRVYTDRQISRALASLDRLGASGGVEDRTTFLKQLAVAVDERDPYLHRHSRRVARHAAGTARRMEHGAAEVALIETAALLHDVGKLHTPPEILQKEGPLTEAEQAVMRRHVEDGATLVQTLGDPRLTAIVCHHHERFDGGGYPSGIAGEEIPLGARVVAVADTFDAITSARPYREGAQDERALDVLRREGGRQLDPDAVDAFIRYYSDRDISVFATMTLSTPRTGFLRTLSSALTGALAASLTAAAAMGLSAPHTSSTSSSAASTPSPSSATPSSSSPSTSSSRTPTSSSSTTQASVPPPDSTTQAPTVAPPSTAATLAPSTSATPTGTAPSPTTTTVPPPLPCLPHCGSGVGTPTTTTTTSATTTPPTETPTSTTPATTTTSATTTLTTATPTSTTPTTGTAPDPCKNGGWMDLGYANQGECESAQNH
ncbi:MAG: HD-GYP domain-containing protein [Solirubrobacteraceae bacterium]